VALAGAPVVPAADALAPVVDPETFSFVVAGHTYGSHHGTNPGLYPRFLDALRGQAGVDFLVLTGDFVREGTEAHLAAVTADLSTLGLPYYLVLGNHDDTPRGRRLLTERFGGTSYTFAIGPHLFVILDRQPSSFDDQQMALLKTRLGERPWRNAFVFVHEVLWLGREAYEGIHANFGDDPTYRETSFWPEVFPLLASHPEVEVFVVAGDVGGRPGAIPAFFDRVGNVNLVASGMGEVEHENLLRIDVDADTGVTLTAVPLQEGKPARPVEWFNPYNLRQRLPAECVHPGCTLPREAGPGTGDETAAPGLWERLMKTLGLP
jgi:hypothetical protein